MAFKMHCDICDAVLPSDQEFVYMVRSGDYQSKDWRYGDPTIGCYPCLEALLSVVPAAVREDVE